MFRLGRVQKFCIIYKSNDDSLEQRLELSAKLSLRTVCEDTWNSTVLSLQNRDKCWRYNTYIYIYIYSIQIYIWPIVSGISKSSRREHELPWELCQTAVSSVTTWKCILSVFPRTHFALGWFHQFEGYI